MTHDMKGRRKLSTVRYKGLGADSNEIWCSVAVELRLANPCRTDRAEPTHRQYIDSPSHECVIMS